MSGESLGLGEEAFGARLETDATLQGLVGLDDVGEIRVYHGWPTELLEAMRRLWNLGWRLR